MLSRFAFLAALAVAGLFFGRVAATSDQPMRDHIGPILGLFAFLWVAAMAWDWIDRNRRPPT